MLVLSRRCGESLLIFPDEGVASELTVAELFAGGPLEITIVKFNGRQARIAIDAPAELMVLRSELQVG